MGTTRGLERLIFFTDAITAIAITLLILPLVETVSDASERMTLAEFFGEEVLQAGAFLVSFVVIARLWLSHHAIFEHVRSYNRRLVFLSLLWALTIVVLPLPTAMTAEFEPAPGVIGFYIGTMTVSSISLTALVLAVRNSPILEFPNHPIPKGMLTGSVLASSGFVLALILGVLIPSLNYWALLILTALGPIGLLLRRGDFTRRPAAEAGSAPHPVHPPMVEEAPRRF